MEQSLLLDQPTELLIKQLSDPGITLKDLDNFCNSNSELRKACRTNPLFIALREGKTPAVDIEVQYEVVGQGDENYIEAVTRTIFIKIYSKVKDIVLINQIADHYGGEIEEGITDPTLSYSTNISNIIQNLPASTVAPMPPYSIPRDILSSLKEYDTKASGEQLWKILFFSEMYGERGRASSRYLTKVTSPFLGVRYHPLESNIIAEESREEGFIIPLEFFRSILDVIQSIQSSGKSGKATIMLSGDVYYYPLENVYI